MSAQEKTEGSNHKLVQQFGFDVPNKGQRQARQKCQGLIYL